MGESRELWVILENKSLVEKRPREHIVGARFII